MRMLTLYLRMREFKMCMLTLYLRMLEYKMCMITFSKREGNLSPVMCYHLTAVCSSFSFVLAYAARVRQLRMLLCNCLTFWSIISLAKISIHAM